MTAITRPEVFRQSLVRASTLCMRRTKHDLMVDGDLSYGWVEYAGDLGTAFHAFQFEYLQTLAEHDAPQMPTQEGIEVMYAVLARLPFVLPFEALDDLRLMVLRFCEIKWPPKRLKAADFEVELRADVVCPDGEVRVFKGTPDVLMFDPPHSLLIIDAKSGRGNPRGPRVEPEAGVVVEERKYLSDLFQGDSYSFLGMRRYPSVRSVKFREYHLRSGQVRQGTLVREQLEHVERKLALLMMKLDEAIGEGEDSPLWRPRPGRHCNRQCPVARSCPIPKEMRGDGALETVEDADAAAGRLAVLEGERSAVIGQLKAWVEEPANPLPHANDVEVVRWDPPVKRGEGKRKFGLWPAIEMTSESEEAA